jgi:hypothetical protein
MKKISIKSFDDLIEFIENHNIEPKDIRELISNTIGVSIFFCSQDNKTVLIKDLQYYWGKYKDKPIKERPLFLLSED